jgi:hypothetical protein
MRVAARYAPPPVASRTFLCRGAGAPDSARSGSRLRSLPHFGCPRRSLYCCNIVRAIALRFSRLFRSITHSPARTVRQQVAHLTDRAAPAWYGCYVMRKVHDIRMGVRNDNRESNGLQAFRVVDVVSHVCGLRQLHSFLGNETRQLLKLVSDAVQAECLQLFCAHCNHRIRFGGKYEGVYSHGLKPLKTQTVPTPTSDRFLALFGDVNGVIRKDAIEVEGNNSYAPYSSSKSFREGRHRLLDRSSFVLLLVRS